MTSSSGIMHCYRTKTSVNLSPGFPHSQRLAALDPHTAVFASGNRLHMFKILYPDVSMFETSKNDDTVSIPVPLKSCQTVSYDPFLRHEIQNIHVIGKEESRRLVAVDAVGTLTVTSVSAGKSPEVAASPSATVNTTDEWMPAEPGKTSVSARKQQYAVSHNFAKTITLVDGPTAAVTRVLSTPLQPLQVVHYDDNLLAVVEYNQLSIWDVRQGSRACVQRHSTPDPLHSVAALEGQRAVACGGAERTVHFVDPVKGSTCGHWRGCLRHDLSAVIVSARDSQRVYAAGVDSELTSGLWVRDAVKTKEEKKVEERDGFFKGMTADSRWVSLSTPMVGTEAGPSALAGDAEYMFGMTESGSLYALHNILAMSPVKCFK